MNGVLVRVVKVGGSLLDWPPLKTVLLVWLERQPAAVNVLVTGGGELADAIRRADATFSIGETVAHWLCIEALGVTAKLLAAIVGWRPPISTIGELDGWRNSGDSGIVFDPGDFLRHHERTLPGMPLPHDWSVTSDSIAARLAEVLGSDELVLLKSQTPPTGDLAELSRLGYVDGYFPRAAAKLPTVRFVNLRDFG
ncbi:MAG: hypothetical protein SFU86_04075 [Pirellulaceae bacterium]|nr:hypothetical protein [Pirellulaceae bacterium]